MRLLPFPGMVVRVLNVAEKNSVARELCNQLAGNRVQTRRSSPYVADFRYSLNQAECDMTVTAVRGHLVEIDFAEEYRKWNSVDPSILFSCPIKASIAHADLATNLRQLSREADWLILWLDCDREGEAIAFEVLEVCLKANRNLRYFRAKFSALTRSDLTNALLTLGQPNRFLSEAVLARSEIDLRVGAAFTRYLTLRYQQRLSGGSERKLVSFGGCQTVTLGFVVSRWLLRDRFQSEPFWSLQLTCRQTRTNIQLKWDRNRIFDQQVVEGLKSLNSRFQHALVTAYSQQPKSKWRPLPLNTLEMTKIASAHLRIPSHQCMQLAEALYAKGIISYPRTETDNFHSSMDLRALVALQSANSVWGSFANMMLCDGSKYGGPRRGSKDDQAHPPIHPLKSVERSDFDNFDEFRVYELVTRHFLACVATDARGSASHVDVKLGSEQFHADGLTVVELNWLEVYPFAKWASTEMLPSFSVGDRLPVVRVEIVQGATQAPSAITEAELLAHMDKEGIGTDATMHEHIRTIQDRGYCYLDNQRFFIPTNLGIALVLGLGSYEPLGFHLAKPTLRADMERDMALISQGQLSRPDFIARYSTRMRQILVAISDNPHPLDTEIYSSMTSPTGMGSNPGEAPPTVRAAYMAPPGAPGRGRGKGTTRNRQTSTSRRRQPSNNQPRYRSSRRNNAS